MWTVSDWLALIFGCSTVFFAVLSAYQHYKISASERRQDLAKVEGILERIARIESSAKAGNYNAGMLVRDGIVTCETNDVIRSILAKHYMKPKYLNSFLGIAETLAANKNWDSQNAVGLTQAAKRLLNELRGDE